MVWVFTWNDSTMPNSSNNLGLYSLRRNYCRNYTRASLSLVTGASQIGGSVRCKTLENVHSWFSISHLEVPRQLLGPLLAVALEHFRKHWFSAHIAISLNLDFQTRNMVATVVLLFLSTLIFYCSLIVYYNFEACHYMATVSKNISGINSMPQPCVDHYVDFLIERVLSKLRTSSTRWCCCLWCQSSLDKHSPNTSFSLFMPPDIWVVPQSWRREDMYSRREQWNQTYYNGRRTSILDLAIEHWSGTILISLTLIHSRVRLHRLSEYKHWFDSPKRHHFLGMLLLMVWINFYLILRNLSRRISRVEQPESPGEERSRLFGRCSVNWDHSFVERDDRSSAGDQTFSRCVVLRFPGHGQDLGGSCSGQLMFVCRSSGSENKLVTLCLHLHRTDIQLDTTSGPIAWHPHSAWNALFLSGEKPNEALRP